MATPTFINALNLPENEVDQPTTSLPLAATSGTSSNKRPALRVLCGRLRLTSYRPFPILLDASDPLVVSCHDYEACYHY